VNIPFVRRPDVRFNAIQAQQLTRGSAVARAPVPTTAKATRVVDVGSIGMTAGGGGGGGGGGSMSSSSTCIRRIMKELQSVAQGNDAVWLHSGEGVHIFPDADNVTLWKALIEGPRGTPFEGGVFALNVVVRTHVERRLGMVLHDSAPPSIPFPVRV
jgi:hypothetical protein